MKNFHLALLAPLVMSSVSCTTTEEIADDDVAGCEGKCDDTSNPKPDPFKELGDIETREFEYIVVGSGAGGGPLAANLARQGHSVLLLEAGKETGGLTDSLVPAFHAVATETADLAWWYFVEHYTDPTRQKTDSKRTPQGILYPRGGGLGGSTAVNAMITVAPKNSDWDNIATITGDTSWRASNMKQYYQKMTRWLGPTERPDVPPAALFDHSLLAILTGTFGEAAANGLGGPSVSPFNPFGNLHAMLEFLQNDINKALLEGNAKGVYQLPLATKDHVRSGTRDYILDTVADEREFPLRVKTQALVTKVVFADEPDANNNWKAVGVEFLDGGNLYGADLRSEQGATNPRAIVVKATREVILSAGAFNTPQLLMLSGIGAKEELEPLGIPVKVDLPGVGKNLQDRYEVSLQTEVSGNFSVFGSCTFKGDQSDPCYRDWKNGRGAYTSSGSVVSILKKSSPDQAEADLHIFGVPGNFRGYYPTYSDDAYAKRNMFSWLILKGHTKNKGGTVKLKSSNPRERPIINFHYFDDGDVDQGQDVNDLTAVVNGVEFVRNIVKRSDGADVFHTHKEVWPGPSANTREKIGAWVKAEAWGHHASCSAPIGAATNPKAVLDSKFRVRGTEGLRVVDASVFPSIPGTFLAVPTYMISEKATDTILESLGETRNTSTFP
ncbi:MAG: GMC family oxidoreductase [Kofleriaceae bacterium]